MNWFRKFMYGRYGVDHLSAALLVVSLILSAIASLFSLKIIEFLSIVPLAYSVFRMLSKNITARRHENEKLLKYWLPFTAKVKGYVGRLKDKNHKYFKCTNCKSILRVPRGKGKIKLICPKCKHETIKKS